MQVIQKLKRSGASVNAYLVLRRGDEVLMALRKNTGYCDGLWSLVAGHVEDGEAASEGMAREAREEIGIEVGELRCIHIMHRRTDRLNVDVFFECWQWSGTIENKEPEKCGGLRFFKLDDLPEDAVEYNILAVKWGLNGQFYSELGWSKIEA